VSIFDWTRRMNSREFLKHNIRIEALIFLSICFLEVYVVAEKNVGVWMCMQRCNRKV
jgi:hypothetical protein